MSRLILLGVLGMVLVGLGGCASPQTDLKSPCVGADGSPCVRRPVNDWWLHIPDQA